MWLKFIGIREVHTIVLEQLLFGSEIDAAARAEAKQAAANLAVSI